MNSFHVVVTDQVFPNIDIELALIESAGGTVEVVTGGHADLLRTVENADALLNTYLPIDAELIGHLNRCKVIARYGIGIDNVDLEAARARGIAVTNVPDYCVEEVATHTVALALALLRRVNEGDALARAGGWGAANLGEMRRVSTLKIGLLGYGRIGNRVADLFRTLGSEIVVHDPYLKSAPTGCRLVDLDELFRSVDVLSIHSPLTSETRGLVGAQRVSTMRPGSYLVNTSRGPIVNVRELGEALKSGHLAGAALDVLETEPPELEDFVAIPNLIVTPHAAYASREALVESQTKAATQVLKALRGEALDYRVN